MAIIFAASAMSSPPVPGGADKPWHALGYLGLAVVVVRALAGGIPRPIDLRIAVTAIAVVVLYGVSDEFHQWFVPGRTAALDDLIADAVGACVGTSLCWAWGIISPPSRDEL
jgi:VanZ family protein